MLAPYNFLKPGVDRTEEPPSIRSPDPSKAKPSKVTPTCDFCLLNPDIN